MVCFRAIKNEKNHGSLIFLFRTMQADFGAVSNAGAVTHDVAAHSKPVKPKNVKRKS